MMDYDPPGVGWLMLIFLGTWGTVMVARLAEMIGLPCRSAVPLTALVVIWVMVLASAWGLE